VNILYLNIKVSKSLPFIDRQCQSGTTRRETIKSMKAPGNTCLLCHMIMHNLFSWERCSDLHSSNFLTIVISFKKKYSNKMKVCSLAIGVLIDFKKNDICTLKLFVRVFPIALPSLCVSIKHGGLSVIILLCFVVFCLNVWRQC
jgi:hypothetical protein